MKKLLTAIILCFMINIPSLAYDSKLKNVANTKKQCSNDGGIWHEFSNNCADLCSAKLRKLICARANIRFSCDCISINECWNDEINECQSYEEYQPYHEQYLEKSKIAIKKIRKKIITKIKKDQENANNFMFEPIGLEKDLTDDNLEKTKVLTDEPKIKHRFINAN